MSSKRKADSQRFSKRKIPGKPETSIPKFITEQSSQPDELRSTIGSNAAKGILEYCATRCTLDFGLLTSAERQTMIRLIHKAIPR